MKIKKIISVILISLGIISGLYGTYGFLYNFITDFGIERVIMAPIILPLYNLPALLFLYVGFKLKK